MTPQERYVTITGFQHYYGHQPFSIGKLILCRKEPDNPHDEDAIQCLLPAIGKVGYLANSVHTLAGGTLSAGRLYESVPRQFLVRVCFTTSTKVICRVEQGDPRELLRAFLFQGLDLSGWLQESGPAPEPAPETGSEKSSNAPDGPGGILGDSLEAAMQELLDTLES